MLKKSILLLSPLLVYASWQNALNSVTNTPVSALTQSSSSSKTDGMSQDYASKGLKEALSLGVTQAVSLLGKSDGFLNNASVKIPLPSSMQTVASVAEKVGGKAYVDDFVKTMNTAASKSIPKTASILSETVSSMSMDDAKKIIAGKETAATDYFKSSSGVKLLAAIMPIIKESVSESKVMSSYQALSGFAKSSSGGGSSLPVASLLGQASNTAKSFGLGDALPQNDEDIEGYVGRKTLDGLFYMIGEKEKALRSNPLSSGSKIIGDIFGR